MSQFGIGTPDAPSNSKPPLSRWLVVVIEELTSAWMPDIVAIVNMTRAMLARVAPVRNFLFIGYAIAVRTTGRHVRPRTSRVATARIESLLNRTISRPPSTSMRPAAMKSVMSAFAMLKNFHGLSTHPTMNAPAAVKTARAGTARIVRTATPNARPTGPRSWSNRFSRRRATTNPRAPRTAIAAPAATCRLVERCGTGSGMSRIARTMFSFDTRHEAMTIVAIVIRKPIANPLMRSESVHVRMNPVPPNADAPKTCENPHRMTPATSRPVKVPTAEDSRAYSRPSDTKLWTRFVRHRDRVDLTGLAQGGLNRAQRHEQVLVVIPGSPPLVADDLLHGQGHLRVPPRRAHAHDEALPDFRLDGRCELVVDDRLRRTQTGAVPSRTIGPDEIAEVPSRVEADHRRGRIEELGRGVDHGSGKLISRRGSGHVRHVAEVRREVVVDLRGEREPPSLG